MLALRLTRAARPAVQLRRLLVAAASAGTGFLLLSCLGYALNHPEAADAAALRLAWCALPLAATVYLALAVARTDPGTRPRPGLSAVGLGPARLMAVSALTTALSCALGSALALLFFLHLRGDLTGMPFDGAAADVLAAGVPLPVPATATLLAVLPATATTTVAVALRPKDPRPPARGGRRAGRFGAYGDAAKRETPGTYGRFRARPAAKPLPADGGAAGTDAHATAPLPAGGGAAGTDGHEAAPGGGPGAGTPAPGAAPPAPAGTPAGLPWGVALVAAGLTAHAYAGRSDPAPSLVVLLGWLVTATGLVVASPGLTHLCGLLLQACRPGALRLLAGRALTTEAARIGRPLGVVCAVASAGCATTALYDGPAPAFGPLSALGALVVAGSTVATLLTAAVEARQCRAGTTAALLRLGAPAGTLRVAAALRAAALLALFAPLTLAIAALSVLPLTR
ncbi:hypothetical protein [Streptomyces cinerochromogenes]|uniref:hypothetical protein n=1 Tax=Streptomyces cinerochromogenes TaxID=66422 RepID=UPI001671414A|nr:hypothetical protein [Streptomyces cinerochromogenes]GGS88400.1 hypothetical protein GCM10010206_58900 [Streptomyces cinerochromogenes]